MAKDCPTCIFKEGSCYPSTTIFDKDKTCKSYEPNYEGYIADLEQKNAELNEKNNRLTRKCECLTQCNDGLQELLSDDIDTLEQLVKARELLKKIEKIVYSGENGIKRLSKIVDVLAEAEQFLKGENIVQEETL